MEISRTEELLPGSERDDGLPAPEAARGEARRCLSVLDWMALIAVVGGGLNSGLIAAVYLDVIEPIFPHTAAARTVYGVIGLAALYCVVMLFRLADELGESAR